MFSIGEFSIITRLSIKTLRYYHEQELLIPDYIDEESGYRYYEEKSVERAFVVSMLRSMEFSIKDIKEVMLNYSEYNEIIDFLELHKNKIQNIIKKYETVKESLDSLIYNIRSNEMKSKSVTHTVVEKMVDDILFSGQRFRGKYHEVGKVFSYMGKKAGRYIRGKAMSLYYDGEYREEADIEAGFPVSKPVKDDTILTHQIEGGKAVTIQHKGSYETIGKSYEALFNYINNRKYKTKLPTREIYVKGSGMIFRGNSDKYITEIQVFIEE